jgi:protein phosphatase
MAALARQVPLEHPGDDRLAPLYAGHVMRTRHFGDTNTGLRRQRNEDAYRADDELGLFLVCDGVGGRARGEIASAETAELIWEWIKRDEPLLRSAIAESASPHAAISNGRVKMSDDTIGRLVAMVRSAVQNACYMVHSMGEVDPAQRGMSTTASVVQCVGELIIVGQVGDSRVYLARDGEVTQLTEDHTWLNVQVQHGRLTPAEARLKGNAGKHIITRAVGLREYVEVDILAVPVQPGDRLLLCSDGLHAYLDSGATLADLFKLNIREAAPAAIRHANACGGADNITALFVEFLAT